MNQKSIFIIISCIVLLAAAIVGAIFLFNTKGLEPETDDIVVEGTWRVYQKGQADPGLNYFVFTDTKISNYRNGSTTPAFESEYTVNGTLMTIVAQATDYSIERKTENVLLLYNQDTEYLIVKSYSDDHLNQPNYNMADFTGNYSVNLHANNVFGEEYINFDGSNFICTRNGEEYLKTTFSVNNNTLSLVTGNGSMDLQICYNDGKVIRLVEKNAAGEFLAWELVAVEE